MRKPFDGNYSLGQSFGNVLIINGVDIYGKYGLKGHDGQDYSLPNGVEILAPHEGRVLEVADQGGVGYGKYVKVENAVEGSILAHLKEQKVKVGDIVAEGQVIGLSDNTGNSTGPHLHWGYYRIPRNRANGYAGYIDQAPYLAAQTDKKYTEEEMTKMREERDKNWNLYQDKLQKEGEYQTKISDQQNAINTLTEKVRLLNEAMAKDAVEDLDANKELLEVSGKFNDLQKEADAIAYSLGVAPYKFTEVMAKIDELRKPKDKEVDKALKDYQKLLEWAMEGMGRVKWDFKKWFQLGINLLRKKLGI